MLTALIGPSEGTASVDGFDIRDRPDDVRARVGILTETPGLYDKLSATANLEFFGRLYGLDAATRAKRIERYLRLFSLWDRRDDVAGTFSKGMKQKLAIARALLHDPAVIFLDEPTAALDPEAAFVVREAIEQLRRAGRTIVLATHNLDEADRLCDRIAFVRGGLLRVDSPARLRGDHGDRQLTIRTGGAGRSGGHRRPGRHRPGDVRRHVPPARGRRSGVDRAGRRPDARRGRRRCRRGPRRADLARVDLLRGHGRPARRRRRGHLMRAGHRDDDPAPRDDGDRPQPTPAVDDPPAADPADGRADRPRRRHRRAVAATRAGRPGREPAAGVGVVLAERAGRRLRGPAVPRVLPADARLHPALDRHVQHHRREAGALPRAGPGGADPDLGTARRARPSRPSCRGCSPAG